jgi:hypothetical protein
MRTKIEICSASSKKTLIIMISGDIVKFFLIDLDDLRRQGLEGAAMKYEAFIPSPPSVYTEDFRWTK